VLAKVANTNYSDFNFIFHFRQSLAQKEVQR
jgi:hypothetical protein